MPGNKEFQGFLIDTLKMTLSLPERKVTTIIAQCEEMRKQHQTSVRELTKLLGTLSSSI
jgi:hypothetical protein